MLPHSMLLTLAVAMACFFLQTKDGKREARGTTQEEFEDIMAILVRQARERLAGYGLTPLFSYDNNKIQAGARFDRMGFSPNDKVPLAPYMPDAHKVIEHAFHQLKTLLWNSIYEHGIVASGRALQDRVQQLFFQISKESIQKDVHDLPLTYKIISTEKHHIFIEPNGHEYAGTGGDWAPRSHR